MGYQFKIADVTLIALLFFKACDKATKYVKPGLATPPAFKEISPDMFKETKDWKYARPNDDVIRCKWWEMFGDAKLNALEDQVNISNQNIAVSEANFRAARALIRESRSEYFRSEERRVGKECRSRWS